MVTDDVYRLLHPSKSRRLNDSMVIHRDHTFGHVLG